MKTFKKYLVTPCVIADSLVEGYEYSFSATIKEELQAMEDFDGEEVTLYEVTFKPIKHGKLSVTTPPKKVQIK